MVEKENDGNHILNKIKNNKYSININHAEDIIELSLRQMNDGEVLIAINTIKELEELIMDDLIHFKEKIDDSDFNTYQENEFVKRMLEDEKLIFKCLDVYKKINKRDPERSSNGIDTWYNYEEKLNSITICARTTLLCDTFNLIAMFQETDLLEKSISQFEFVNVIEKVTFSKWLALVGIKMPMTFTNRDVALIGVALFDRKEKLFIIVFRSTDKSEYNLVPNCDDKHERIDMHFGFYIGKYLNETTCEIFSCFNVDPKVSVPWFILNQITKDVGYYMMADFKKIVEADDFSKKYEERINQKKDDYEKIRKAMLDL